MRNHADCRPGQVRDIVGFPFRTGKVHGIVHYTFSERDENGKGEKSSLTRIDYVPAPKHYSFPRPNLRVLTLD